MNYNKYLITEKVTKGQLDALEKILDALYASKDIDIEFTTHFFDRVNDARNKRDITIPELRLIFGKAYERYADSFKGHGSGWEAILKDLQTDINIPFILRWNKRKKKIDLINKTIMRKKRFLSHDKELKV